MNLPSNMAVESDVRAEGVRTPMVRRSLQRSASKIRLSLLVLNLVCAATAGAATQESVSEVQRTLAKIGLAIASKPCDKNAQRIRERIRNPFDESVIDQRETIRCGKLELVVYHAYYYKPPRRMLEWLILQSAHIELPKQISPGATRDEVLAYAGKPMSTSPTTFVYRLNDEGPDLETATFQFSKGKLVSIAWWWSSQ